MTDKDTSKTIDVLHSGNESHLLREIARTHQVLMTGFSRKVGLTASRLALMRLLATAEENVGVMDLARRLGINAAAVTRQVKEMEKDGVVQRLADLKDGRRSSVKLTAKGCKLFKTIHGRGHELEHAVSSILSAAEIATTVGVLARLRSFAEIYMRGETL